MKIEEWLKELGIGERAEGKQGEVREENKENKQEQKVEEPAKANSQQVNQIQQQQQYPTDNLAYEQLKNHILEARIRFIRDYPEAEEFLNQVHQIAYSQLVADYQRKQLKSDDFYDYLQEAWKNYKEFMKKTAERISLIEKNPNALRRKKKGEEEKELTPDEYYKWYVNEYLPSITKDSNFIEEQIYVQGKKVPRYIRGRERWYEGQIREREEKTNEKT